LGRSLRWESDTRSEIQVIKLKLDDLYISKASGAFVRSRARWIEKGERNTAYFFALEKRNFKRNSLSALLTTPYARIPN